MTHDVERRRIQLARPHLSDEAIANAVHVLRSGWIGPGPQAKAFESAFARYLGAPYCITTNSGTSALHLAVRSLGLQPGGEVLTTAITYISTNLVLLYENLKPVFADIDPRTGNVSVDSLRERITPRTTAIIVVHLFGMPSDLDDIHALAREHDLRVVEDCAHAIGSAYRGRRIGSWGDVQAFSFQACKNLTTIDGGAVIVRDEVVARGLRRMRNLGIDRSTFDRFTADTRSWEYDVPEVGFKYEMNDVAAAIGVAELDHLDHYNAHRRNLTDHYRERLASVSGLELLAHPSDRVSANMMFAVLVESRDRLALKLNSAGVEVSRHFPRCDLFPMFEKADLPEAERWVDAELSLPMHADLTDEDIDYVCDVIVAGW